jgi:uncharacterized protein YeeX (DUF496 family)
MLELFLQDIILNVSTVYCKPVYCHIGNSANISKELTDLMKANTTRYPLFAFMRPFKVIDKGDHYDVTIRRVAIATVTLDNVNELTKIRTNFETYLRPLNEIFRNILAEDKRIICGVNGIEYTSEDMPFFNSNSEPSLTEKLDGIVIDNLNIKLNKSKINCNLNT